MTANQASRTRRRLRGEDGFIIVEVLVSAVILVTVSLAVFLTLDNADKAAGNQQKRTLAANFAQSELERIRSLPVEDVAAARGTRTVTANGITYTETLVAKWVTDGSDEPECTTRSGGLDYLRTTVSISWNGMGQAKPVTMTTFYTPPAGAGGGDTGSASVHITDRNGNPVAGIGVTLDGPQDFSDTTNVNGCVVFGFVPESTAYTIRFSRAGFVDGDSNPTVADPVTVTGGETTKLQYDYDQGGTTEVRFLTRRGGAEIATNPLRLQFFNAAQPSGPKTIPLDGTVGTWTPGSGTTASRWQGPSVPLFPFTGPYAVYAGNCKANAVPNTNSDSKFVNITPNALQNTGIVYVPALDVTVYSGTGPSNPGTTVSNAIVQYDPGCTPIYQRTTDATGKLVDPGFPYSTTGTVCAMSPGRRVRKAQANVNTAVGTPVNLYLGDPTYSASPGSSNNTSCFV